MSFNDLERGDGPGPNGNDRNTRGGPAVTQSAEDQAFNKLKDSVAIQIFKIQTNVQGIQRLVDKLGTAQDGPSLRKSLTDLTESTREMVKKSTDDVKRVASWPADTSPTNRKPIQSKISKDFTAALTGFQKVQRLSAERQRHYVEDQKRAVHDAAVGGPLGDNDTYRDEDDDRGGRLANEPLQQQEQVAKQTIAPQELAFQESLIAERESEIREIESGIHELNEIFRDLGTIVVEQGGMIDNIESNVTSVAQNTRSAAEELTTAHEYQRKAGRRMLCLALILVVVASIVLLAILS